MSTFKIVMLSVLGLVLMIALAFVMELGGLKWDMYFAPKHENVKRKVFQATRSYNESKVQDLARFKLQYDRADAEDKMAIATTIRTMFADYDSSLMPNGLGAFLTQIRGY
jgi:hypothetical protein